MKAIMALWVSLHSLFVPTPATPPRAQQDVINQVNEIQKVSEQKKEIKKDIDRQTTDYLNSHPLATYTVPDLKDSNKAPVQGDKGYTYHEVEATAKQLAEGYHYDKDGHLLCPKCTCYGEGCSAYEREEDQTPQRAINGKSN